MKKQIIIGGLFLAFSLLAFRHLYQPDHSLVINVKTLENRLERTADFKFKPTRASGTIDWEQFPEFHLSPKLKLVYMGARFPGYDWKCATRHGFTHINFVNLTDAEKPQVPPKQRAIMVGANFYTDQGSNFSYHSKGIFDPFEDNQKFLAYTRNLGEVCNLYKDCGKAPNRRLKMDIVCFDLENVPDGPSRANLAGSNNMRFASEQNFQNEYMQAMSEKYYLMLKTTREQVVSEGCMVSSCFPGAPIINQYFSFRRERAYFDAGRKAWLWNVPAKNGKFQQEQMDFTSPSYYAATANVLAKDEIHNLLFDQETNAVWSKLPRIPLVWLFQSDKPDIPLKPRVSEAFAIFNFMSGAAGVWFWDLAFFVKPNTPAAKLNYSCYEYYLAGLYKLSRHNDIFDNDYEAIIPEVSFDGGRSFQKYNALELANKSLPIVRAIVGSDKILVAAYNSYAQKDQKIDLVVKYGSWQDVITLNADEVYLGKASLK